MLTCYPWTSFFKQKMENNAKMYCLLLNVLKIYVSYTHNLSGKQFKTIQINHVIFLATQLICKQRAGWPPPPLLPEELPCLFLMLRVLGPGARCACADLFGLNLSISVSECDSGRAAKHQTEKHNGHKDNTVKKTPEKKRWGEEATTHPI